MDRSLIERAQQGDEEAFATVALAMVDRLHAVAYRILRDFELAEDATQQALLAVWRNLPQLRDPGQFDAWSYRLLVHACYDEGRRTRRWIATRPRAADRTTRPTRTAWVLWSIGISSSAGSNGFHSTIAQWSSSTTTSTSRSMTSPQCSASQSAQSDPGCTTRSARCGRHLRPTRDRCPRRLCDDHRPRRHPQPSARGSRTMSPRPRSGSSMQSSMRSTARHSAAPSSRREGSAR